MEQPQSSSPEPPSDSEYQTDYELVLMYEQNRSLSEPWFTVSAIAYSLLILITFLGNSLVIWAVARRKELWNPRNIFILNLAISDILLCFTMVVTAIDVLTKYWPFGQNTLLLCRTVKASPCFAVYLSSLTIVVIAIDRYRCITGPNKPQLSNKQAILILPMIFALALLMSTPIFFHTHLHIPEIAPEEGIEPASPQNFAVTDEDVADSPAIADFEQDEVEDYWSHLVFCIEDWNYGGAANTSTIQRENKRHLYSIFSLFVQYILPFLLISVVYSMIYCYLKEHRIVREDKASDRQKARRTNAMLVSISVLYCLCWLPLNLFNLLVDIADIFEDDLEMMLLTFIFCHLLGMSSASINPILYGYLNESFRKEFMDILQPICWWKTETTEAAAGGGAHQMGNGRTAEAGGEVELKSCRPCAAALATVEEKPRPSPAADVKRTHTEIEVEAGVVVKKAGLVPRPATANVSLIASPTANAKGAL